MVALTRHAGRCPKVLVTFGRYRSTIGKTLAGEFDIIKVLFVDDTADGGVGVGAADGEFDDGWLVTTGVDMPSPDPKREPVKLWVGGVCAITTTNYYTISVHLIAAIVPGLAENLVLDVINR